MLRADTLYNLIDSALSSSPFRPVIAGLFALLLSWGLGAPTTFAQQLDRVDADVLQQARADFHGDDLQGKDGPLSHVGLELALLYREHQQYQQSGTSDSFQPKSLPENRAQADAPDDGDQRGVQANVSGYISPVRGEMVVVDAIPNESPASLKQTMQAIGAEDVARYKNLVSAKVPIERIPDLAAASSLQNAQMAHAEVKSRSIDPRLRAWMTRMANGEVTGPPPAPASKAPLPGQVISEGDSAMNTDNVRENLGIDGAGVKIGVLSDSYNANDEASNDIQDGDLPPEYRIDVLDDPSSGFDEGRAMMQLIHDVAPGADMAFHTAFGGRANFAQGIKDLADAGADVTVDDVGYFTEPFFQNGPIAQAVNTVASNGVPHFASAGNSADQSYESDSWSAETRPNGTPLYDFDPSSSVDTSQTVEFFVFGPGRIVFQWDDPAASASQASPGADTDLDLELYDRSADTLVAQSATDNIGGDPVEILRYAAPFFQIQTLELRIVKATGPDPGRVKYTHGSLVTPQEYLTNSSTSVGHPNAQNGAGVAAASFASTPEYGTDPAEAEPFTSLGGTPILFNPDGSPKSSPEVREQPRFTGPDSTSTTVSGFDQFSGTSASAPHVAALAALQLQANPSLDPTGIYTALEDGAEDMTPSSVASPNGFDFLTGYGFVNADSTITSVSGDPDIAIGTPSPSSIDFGAWFFDTDAGALYDLPPGNIVEIVNAGTADLTINSVSISGSDFRYESGSSLSSGTLAPGERDTAVVRFDPGSTGTFSEAINTDTVDPDESTVSINLNGESILPPVVNVSVDSLFEAVEAGSTATQTFTVSNTGANQLEYDIFAENLGIGPFSASEVAAPPTNTSSTTQAKSPSSVESLAAPQTQDSPFNESDFIYTIDDGTNETSLGIRDGADIVWLNAFEAKEGATTITALATAFGSSQPLGSNVEFLLYEDPNDDGDPTDANLLESVTTTTDVSGNADFQIEPIPPTEVEGVFFVAVLVPSTSNFPAPLDEDSDQGASWVANADPGTFDTSDLSGSSNQSQDPPSLTADIGYPGNWLLRAQGAYATFQPISDSVSAGNSKDVDIKFRGTTLSTGRYQANAAVTSNDPDTSKIGIPFDFFVADAVGEATLDSTNTNATFDDTGVRAELNGESGSGTVTAMRFDDPPSNVSGLASGESAGDYRWFIRQDGDLSFDQSSELRFLRADIPGPGFDESNGGDVVVYRRSSYGSGTFSSSSLTSNFDNGGTSGDLSDDAIVATGATDFSEFIFASDTAPLPVEVSSFEATRDDNDVVLSWRTASETNNAGFRLERKAETKDNWTVMESRVDGSGTTTEPQTYQYRAKEVTPNTYTFRLKSVSTDGTVEVEGETTVEMEMEDEYAVSPVHPNPVSGRGQFQVQVRETQEVRVTLYNVLGQKVRILHDGVLESNTPQTLRVDGTSLANGVYFVRVSGDTFQATQKVTLAR